MTFRIGYAFILMILGFFLQISGYGQEFEFVNAAPAKPLEDAKAWKDISIHSSGNVYMIDGNNKSVQVFNAVGAQIQTIISLKTADNTIGLVSPTQLAIDKHDNLYIYDSGLGKMLVQPAKGPAYSFGEKGSDIGQLSSVLDITVDSKGYIYVLNGSSKQVDIFSNLGEYVTWISGTSIPFINPTALGMNGADELYVLENEGPTVFIFNLFGNLVNTNRSLAAKKGVRLSKPSGMAVLSNGDFFILDETSSQATLFSRIGVMTATLGSKGSTGKGTFEQAEGIAAGTAAANTLVIGDFKSRNIQMFRITGLTSPLKAETKRLRYTPITRSRQPAVALATAPNGNRYVIPASDNKKVIAYKDTTEKDVFTLTGKFEEAVALAVDSASNCYVVDRSLREVLMFDDKGNLIRQFGKEMKEKLKDPVSIITQKSGNIIVADKSRGSLFMWNSQGVFQKVITSAENSVIKSPRHIERDSKDQIYVWDDDANCIYRLGSGGWPTAEKKLLVRNFKPGDKEGKIGAFFVDPLDNIHVFNETTHQVEVYKWDFEPQCVYSMGKEGTSANSFGDVTYMLPDAGNLDVYFTLKKGASQKVFQFVVPPPKPEGSLTYDVIDGKLQIYFGKVKSPSVVAHGLIQHTADGDSLSYRTTTSTFTIEPNPNDASLKLYDFVSMSWSDYSDPSTTFYDYFTFGNQLLQAHQYEEALGAWQISLQNMGQLPRMAEYISGKLTGACDELIKRHETNTALAYAKESFVLAPKSPETLNTYARVLKAYYRTLANEGDYTGMIAHAEKEQANTTIKPIVLGVLDSLSQVLGLEESLSSILYAINTQKQLIQWDILNPGYKGSLSASYLELYKFKSIRNVSQMELKSILDEAIKFGKQGYDGLKKASRPYFEVHLVLLEASNEFGNYEDVQKQATSELGSAVSGMIQSVVIRYRKQLAIAFAGSAKYDLAESEYNAIIALTPSDISMNESLAEVLIAEKKYDTAKGIYQQLMLGTSVNAEHIARIGYIELQKGNYAEAIFQLEKSIQQNPGGLINYGYLAEAYQLSSNNKKALDNYEVALQFQDETLNKAGQRNFSPNKLNALSNEREKYLLSTAKIYDELNDSKGSLETYQKLTTINSTNAVAWYGLGKACQSSGRIYDAITAYDNALNHSPSNDTYKNAYVHIIKMRDGALKSEQPLNILQIDVRDIFPSMYLNYADVQRMPIGEVVLANNTPDPITPTTITVFVAELMTQPTQVEATMINGYSNQRMKLSALFPESILANNDKKSLQVEVTVTYASRGNPVTIKKSSTFTLNGRNAISWSDKRFMAAFVSPKEEKLIDYNKAADQVFRESPSYGMNKTLLKAMQLYTLLNESGIVYSRDPAQSYATVSIHSDILDYLQYPTETLKRKGGDCDDLVSLYASLLENGGVSAAYIDLPGHVMLAFDSQIKPLDIATSGLSHSDVIVIGERVWIPIETTMLGSKNFLVAWKSGAERFYSELHEGHFPELIPFADAWSIYNPSTYITEGFNSVPSSEKKMKDTYGTLVSQLVVKTKQETISDLSNRYLSEENNSYVKNRYATLLAQTGEMEMAEKVFLEALEISPENASVLNNLGNIYFLEGKNDQATSYYEQAAKWDAADPNIFINLCKVNIASGNKPNAKMWLDKAIGLDAELGDIYIDLKTQLK